MRVAVLLFVASCGFSVQGAGSDAAPDTVGPVDAVDAPPQITWSIDTLSGKAVPASRDEWTDLIAAHQLGIAPPNALWLLQESSGNLDDILGAADLSPSGAVGYREPVAGWSRFAVKTTDDTVASFSSKSTTLPDVAASSITVLMYFAREPVSSAPSGPRTVFIAGADSRLAFGRVDIAPSGTLAMTVMPNTASGTNTYTQGVEPIVFVHDRGHMRQRVITTKETIAPTYTARLPSRGLFLGGADYRAPEGRWLYLAAWYGASAELDETSVRALLTALGW